MRDLSGSLSSQRLCSQRCHGHAQSPPRGGVTGSAVWRRGAGQSPESADGAESEDCGEAGGAGRAGDLGRWGETGDFGLFGEAGDFGDTGVFAETGD